MIVLHTVRDTKCDPGRRKGSGLGNVLDQRYRRRRLTHRPRIGFHIETGREAVQRNYGGPGVTTRCAAGIKGLPAVYVAVRND